MHRLLNRLSIFKDLLVFFWHQRLWWIIPFIIVLLLVSVLVAFAYLAPVVPFLYTAF